MSSARSRFRLSGLLLTLVISGISLGFGLQIVRARITPNRPMQLPIPRCGPGSTSGARCGSTSGASQYPVPVPNMMMSPQSMVYMQQMQMFQYQFQMAQFLQWMMMQQQLAAYMNGQNAFLGSNFFVPPAARPGANNGGGNGGGAGGAGGARGGGGGAPGGGAAPAGPRFCCNMQAFANSAVIGGQFLADAAQCSLVRAGEAPNCDGGNYLGADAAVNCRAACTQLVGWCWGHPTYLSTPARPRLFTQQDCQNAALEGGAPLDVANFFAVRTIWMRMSEFPTYERANDYMNWITNHTSCGNGVVDAGSGEECDHGQMNGRGAGCELDCTLDRTKCNRCESINNALDCTSGAGGMGVEVPCRWENDRCTKNPQCLNAPTGLQWSEDNPPPQRLNNNAGPGNPPPRGNNNPPVVEERAVAPVNNNMGGGRGNVPAPVNNNGERGNNNIVAPAPNNGNRGNAPAPNNNNGGRWVNPAPAGPVRPNNQRGGRRA